VILSQTDFKAPLLKFYSDLIALSNYCAGSRYLSDSDTRPAQFDIEVKFSADPHHGADAAPANIRHDTGQNGI
jgi:hypothetical protein